MTTTNPLTLCNMWILNYNADSDVANEHPGHKHFHASGHRQDLLIEDGQCGLGVLLQFLNRRLFASGRLRGIRRKVTVILTDDTTGRKVADTSVNVSIARDRLYRSYRVDIPLTKAMTDTSHTYSVSVFDQSDHILLESQILHFFDETDTGCSPDQWFTPVSGRIMVRPSERGDYSDAISYRSIEPSDNNRYSVRFDLTPNVPSLTFCPEMEIRIHFHNGDASPCMCRAVHDTENGLYFEAPLDTIDIYRGACYAELICLDYAVAGFAFSTNGPSDAGLWEGKELECLDYYSLDNVIRRLREKYPAVTETDDLQDYDFDDNNCNNNSEELDFDRLLDEFIQSQSDSDTTDDDSCSQIQKTDYMEPLNQLVGLESVKTKLSTYYKLVRFNQMRQTHDLLATDTPLHAMFLGSPGTGKTTVAKIMGQMLADAGVLSNGHVVVKERATLLGQNYSSESENTLKAIEEAQGGILLIDEAYQLYQPHDPRDPGKFVIETLMTALADTSRRDWMLILSGYSEPTMRMFEINPGLKSRIPESNIYTFSDFSETELMHIANMYFDLHQYVLTDDARDALTRRLKNDYEHRDSNFGNARHVVTLIETEILPAMAVRVIDESAGECPKPYALKEIKACDIPQPTTDVRSCRQRQRVGFRA